LPLATWITLSYRAATDLSHEWDSCTTLRSAATCFAQGERIIALYRIVLPVTTTNDEYTESKGERTCIVAKRVLVFTLPECKARPGADRGLTCLFGWQQLIAHGPQQKLQACPA